MRFRLLSFLFVGALVPLSFAWAAQDSEDTEEKEETLPLAASETLSFSVTEGTWMSLDLSPDGQTIVFELLGDLYTLPISGGTATRIIGELSFESQPVFSPDKDRITMDPASRTLDVEMTDAEFRKAEPPESLFATGALAKYARTVSSASRGAVTTAGSERRSSDRHRAGARNPRPWC